MLVLGLQSVMQPPVAADRGGKPPIVPNEVLVNFQPGVSTADIATFYAKHGLVEKERLGFAPGDGPRLRLAQVKPPGEMTDPARFISTLEQDLRVEYAELNYILSIALHPPNSPDDPSYDQLWSLNNTGQNGGTPDADIDAPEAWHDFTTGSSSTIVGIIDTGVNYNHPDLAANMWTNPGEIPNNNIDDDGNGYVDDIYGINAITNTFGDGNPTNPMDDHGHGTHVAGTIGAKGNNGIGVMGVNWTVSIAACKFLSASGSGSTANAIKCFNYFNHLKNMLGQNVLVTNNSWGGGGFSQALYDAMQGLDQPGMPPILHAAAAGNSNNDNDSGPHYPSNYDLPNIIAVAATDSNDLYAGFSSYGATSVDLAAPGVSILSTVPSGACGLCDPSGYRLASGTSMATPHVAGAAALVWAQYKSLSASQVKQRILVGVDSVSASKQTLTDGRLNVFNALKLMPDTIAPAAVGDLIASDPTLASVTLRWTATGDDGDLGTASAYDIRYSTSPLTPGNFAAAIQAVGEPSPQPPGSTEKETFTVSGLDSSITYHFALKVKDEWDNESGLSNVATESTATGTTVFQDDMEGGVNGWTSGGLWHQETKNPPSPTTSWAYNIGDPNYNYDVGTNSGSLTSPVINLSAYTSAILKFNYWYQTETTGNTWDQRWIKIGVDGVFTNVAQLSGETMSVWWHDYTLDLTAYAGSPNVQIRFSFNTIDGVLNNFEGWYVDDIVVVADPPSGPPDTAAPAAVDDLIAATGTDEGEVVLNWNATGDDDTLGTATSYDLRYSTTPIPTGVEFATAFQVTGVPAPKPAEQPESMNVGGLGRWGHLPFCPQSFR